MSFYELYNENGDSGMLVVNAWGDTDATFRREADAAQRPDERLLSVDPQELMNPEAIQRASEGAAIRVGQMATREAIQF